MTTNTLNGDSKPTATKDALGDTSKTSYDAAGNTVQTVDPNGHSTEYVYNKDNQESGSVDPDGDQSTTDYSKLGQTSAGYDGNQNGSFSGYNADGDDTGSGQATGAAVNSLQCPEPRVQVNDADGNVTTFLLDRDGNQVAEISPLGYFSYTAYNQDNQPVTQVDADGRTTASTYDPAGRLITLNLEQRRRCADERAPPILTIPWGTCLPRGNAYGSYTFMYDPANRVYTQTDPFKLHAHLRVRL